MFGDFDKAFNIPAMDTGAAPAIAANPPTPAPVASVPATPIASSVPPAGAAPASGGAPAPAGLATSPLAPKAF